MWPDRVSNPGPPTYESGALPIALRGPAACDLTFSSLKIKILMWDIVFFVMMIRINRNLQKKNLLLINL